MIKKLTIFFNALLVSLPLLANTYYIDSNNGSDANNGLTKKTAIKTLKRANTLSLKHGDKLLLANGQVFNGTLELINVSGSKPHPVIVSNYSLNKNDISNLPIIDARGYRNGVLLMNCNYVFVSNLHITADAGGVPDGSGRKTDMRCGVLITCDKAEEYKNIHLSCLKINDVFYADKGVVRSKKETNSANGTQAYGWGIRLINRIKGAVLKNITVEGCRVENVGHTGIKATGGKHSIRNLQLYNNIVTHTGGPGMQMSGILDGHVKGNTVTYSGSATDTRKWGRGSGLWTWGCSKVLIEHNSFRHANGPADSAGCHIDFNCDNVIVQYNVSEENAGGFCEILGNNYNCAYRYNISINDGHRVKKVNGAFQEGKIFWLSGFNGKGKEHNGPFNSYFYNNTIYVKADIVAKMAVTRTAQGILLANNIFYIEGDSKLVMGDQYKPATKGESLIKNVIFKNNLFLKADNWPVDVLIQDEAPVLGNPRFTNTNGNEPINYIPENKSLIKDKGIQIENLPGDKKGLFIGLKVEKDILGNKIKGLPDMGAIELK